MAYRLELLAGVRVLREDEPVESLAGHRQKLAFVAYLALQPGFRASRERLLPVFWPDRDESTARHSLSQLVYELRREVADLLEATADAVRLVPSAFECDAVQFEKAAHAGDVTRAAALYRGELLEGFSLPGSAEFERWVEDRRGQLQRLHRKVAREHVAALRTQGRLEDAIEAARRWLAADPFEDEAHHALIELLFRAGERAAALEHYERYVRLCRDELEVEPLEETRALVERMRAGEPGARAAPAEPTYAAATAPPARVREAAPTAWSASGPSAAEGPATTLGQLIGELKRRYVFRVAVVYAIIAWLVVQVAKATFEDLYLPSWAMTFVIVLAILGFPIAVVLAWAFEITPEGVRRTSPAATPTVPTATRSALLVLDAPPRSAGELFQELFRRRVLFVLALYLGVAIVAIRAVGPLRDRFGLPDWVVYVVYAAIVAGLPLAVGLAWVGGASLGAQPGAALGAIVVPRDQIPVGLRWVAAVRPPLLMGALGAVAVALVAVQLSFPRALPMEKGLAVLPFMNVGGDPANQAFCDGLVETLTSKLSQLEQFQGSLWVVPSSEVLARRIQSPSEAKDSFQVNLVLTGSVQRAGDSVRVAMNLVDARARPPRVLRSADVRESIADPLGLQDAIVLKFEKMLEFELPLLARELLAAGGTAVPQAYDLYVQGWGHLQRYEHEESVDRAIALFRVALDHDPNYALAHAALGEAYLRKYGLSKDPQWIQAAKASAERAIRLNDRLGPVHVTLGLILGGTGRYEEAVQEFQRALEIDPVSAEAHRALAQAYEALEKLEEAEATYRRAIELRPGYWAAHNDLGRFYYTHGRYEEAAEAFRRVIELTPDNVRGYNNLGGIYYLLGRCDDAEAMLQRSVAIRPTADAYSNLGTVYFFCRHYAAAVPMMEKAIELGVEDYVLWGNLADAYRWKPGLARKATEAYRRAILLAERELTVNPNDADVRAKLAAYWAKLGNREKAVSEIGRARRLAPANVNVLFKAAVVFEVTGERELALEALKAALAGGYSPEEVQKEPDLAELRRDPRYELLVSTDVPGAPRSPGPAR